jgi:hypothetical protein
LGHSLAARRSSPGGRREHVSLLAAGTGQGHSHTTFAQLTGHPCPKKKKEVRKKKEAGAKGHFTALLSPRNPEMNILFSSVSTS